MNFSIKDALPGDSPLFYGRTENLGTLRRLCADPGQNFGLIYGGPRSGKSSLINRLLAELPTEVRGMPIYLRGILDKSLAGVLAYIVRQTWQFLAPEASPPERLIGGLAEALTPAVQQSQYRVSVLIIYGLGSLEKEVRWEFANQLCGLYGARTQRPSFTSLQIILCGGLELYDLAEKDINSPLAGMCEAIYLDDLNQAEAGNLVDDTMQRAHVTPQEAREWADLVYQYAGGHPYLTQLFGTHILKLRTSNNVDKLDLIEYIFVNIVQQDRIFRAIHIALEEYELHNAVQRLIANRARWDLQTEQLRILGLVDDSQDIWRVRNHTFHMILSRWAHQNAFVDRATIPTLESLAHTPAFGNNQSFPELITLLDELRLGNLSRDAARERIVANIDLRQLFAILAGTTAQRDGSIITFGQDSQFGDLQISGGIAGRDVYHLSFPLDYTSLRMPDSTEFLRRRITAYEGLFRLLGNFLAIDTPAESLTIYILSQFITDLSDWYDGRIESSPVGGLYLSDACHHFYFELRDNINEKLAIRSHLDTSILSADDIVQVQAIVHSLRHALQQDIKP